MTQIAGTGGGARLAPLRPSPGEGWGTVRSATKAIAPLSPDVGEGWRWRCTVASGLHGVECPPHAFTIGTQKFIVPAFHFAR
jgi:hypothetical protein